MRQLKIKPSSSRAFDVSVESSRGVIEVKGTGKLFIPANLYVLKIEIEKRFDTNEEAYSTSKDCIKEINDILKQSGLNSTEAKTTRLDIIENKISQYKKGKYIGEKTEGFRLFLWLSIYLPTKNEIVNKVIMRIQEEIPYCQTDLQSSLIDYEKFKDEALSKAVKDARRKAEIIASALGGNLGSIIGISNENSDRGSYSVDKYLMEIGHDTDETELEMKVKDIEISETVETVWEILN